MNDDHRLSQLLRASMPSIGDARPSDDLWPAVVRRARQRERVSAMDVSVLAVVVVALLMFPQWFWFLAYHL